MDHLEFGLHPSHLIARTHLLQDTLGQVHSICHTIPALPLDVGQRAVHLTASLGESIFPTHAASAERVISPANKALNHSKNHGRNQVRLAAPTREA
jgi:predicted signal transduction protein with EAL and GGDEF domain